MNFFIRCLRAEFLKTKGLSVRKVHIMVPICVSFIFLLYYSFAMWTDDSKVEAYFQVLGIGFPFLIGLFTVILSEQEQNAGNFGEMLSAPKRLPIFFSKIVLLIFMGTFSVILASYLFGVGFIYILKKQVVGLSFYGKMAVILIGSSIFLYVWHMFLSFRFNKGVSIGICIVESLVSALFLTGLGDRVWPYTPCAWPARFATYFLAVTKGSTGVGADCIIAILLCTLITLSSLILYGFWALHWEGQHTHD